MKFVKKPLILLLISIPWLGACAKQPDKQPPIAGEPPAVRQVLSEVQTFPITNPMTPVDSGTTALLKEIQNLTVQRQADLVPNSPGWLHLIVRRFNSTPDPFSTWDASGGEIQLEQWLSLDDQGRVHADIERLLNDQGQAREFNLQTGGRWTNLPLARFATASNTLPFDPSYGIYGLAIRLVSQGQAFNKSTLYKECWYQGEKYTLSDGQITREIVIKPDSHALRWIKTWQVSSGVITLVDSLEIALEERLPRPPDDILALASQIFP